MNRSRCRTIAPLSFVLIFILDVAWQARAQGPQMLYPGMASIEQYLITDRNAEIALARSAAPEAISRDAKILVLGRHGYETAVEGKNGFVCAVERAWMGPFEGAEMVLAGRSKAQIIEATKGAYDKKELPALEPGAMSYMMSKEAYLTDAGDHNVAHLMFYTPLMDGAAWGADLPNSPVMLTPQSKDAPPIDVFIVPVGRWSDGTAAPVM